MGESSVRMGQTRIGIVCEPSEPPSTPVRISMPGSDGVGDRCTEVRSPSGSGMVCISTVVPAATVPATVTRNDQVPIVASSSMVGSSAVDAATAVAPSASDATLSGATSVADTAPFGSQLPSKQRIESETDLFGEGRLKSLGYSKEVIDRLVKSHATSTKKQYKSQWSLFVGWATEKRAVPCDPTSPSIKVLAEFLTWLFQERGLSTGSVTNYKSVISFF